MSKKTFHPLGDRVLVVQDTLEETTESGIIIPDSATQEKPLSGIIVALGTDLTNQDLALNELIYFGKYSGSEVTFNGQDFLIINEGDIQGVLR